MATYQCIECLETKDETEYSKVFKAENPKKVCKSCISKKVAIGREKAKERKAMEVAAVKIPTYGMYVIADNVAKLKEIVDSINNNFTETELLSDKIILCKPEDVDEINRLYSSEFCINVVSPFQFGTVFNKGYDSLNKYTYIIRIGYPLKFKKDYIDEHKKIISADAKIKAVSLKDFDDMKTIKNGIKMFKSGVEYFLTDDIIQIFSNSILASNSMKILNMAVTPFYKDLNDSFKQTESRIAIIDYKTLKKFTPYVAPQKTEPPKPRIILRPPVYRNTDSRVTTEIIDVTRIVD
jgi:hypothetical protein